MPSFFPRIVGNSNTFSCNVSWGSSCLWKFLRPSLFLRPWHLFRSTGMVFWRKYLTWGFFWHFFSRLDWGTVFWRGKPQRQKAILITSWERYMQSISLITLDVKLDHAAQGRDCRFQLSSFFSLHLYYILLQRVTMYLLHLQSQYMLHLLKDAYLCKLIEIVLHVILYYLFYLIMYFSICTHRYFIQ